MGSVVGPLMAAVFQRASGDAALTGLAPGGVHQFVQEGTAAPYVRIGPATETPYNTHDTRGANTTLVLHVFDRARHWDRVSAIADRLVDLFDHETLSLTGHRTVACRFDQTLHVPDPDIEIRHATVRFIINTQQE